MMLAACRPRSDDLGPGPDPADVLVALAHEPGLACLWGSWFGDDSVLIMSRPRATSSEVAVLDSQPRTAVPADAPPSLVGGGWVGWLGYDVAAHLAFYDHLLRFDYGERRWSFQALWTRRRASALRARRQQLRELLAAPPTAPPSVFPPAGDPAPPSRIGEFAGPDRDRHLGAIEAAIGLIRAGEIYQANICTRLAADFDGPPESGVELFARAVGELRPRFAAFISTAERAVISLSPESFLSRTGDRVTSSPIKGTWARGADEGSELSAARLRSSAKDVAENVMIVDLVRNDLGRVARPGTVRVERLLDVQPHPGVWHLVSTVSGQLRPSVGDAALVAATFPPGSVTGTPKLRAMSAIADIEDAPRGVYTGAIGIAGPVCGLQLSVAIRTFELVTDRARHPDRARRRRRHHGRQRPRARVARMRAEGDAAAARAGRPSAGGLQRGRGRTRAVAARRRLDRDHARGRRHGAAARRSPGPARPIGARTL